MYTKVKYSNITMVKWTSIESFQFLLLALFPVILYEVFELKWLHLPWVPIALIGTAVAFVIGFQNNASYDRIWEARKIWGGIVNSSRSWGIMVNDFISNEYAEEKANEVELKEIKKELIYRHIAWMTSLRHTLRAPKPWENFLSFKSNRRWSRKIDIREFKYTLEEELEPYVSKTEFDYLLSKTNKATHSISLQSKQLKALKQRGLIDDFRHVVMEKALVEFYDMQGQSERIKNFPYPRHFATLNHNFVWIFLILIPFGIMYEFDLIGRNLMGEYPTIGKNFVWFSVPFSIIVSWVFHTMERIGKTGENPFEGTANDVPITTMSRAIEIDLREMLDEDPATIPNPHKAVFDTEM